MNKRQILEYLLETNTSISLVQVGFSLLMAVLLGGLLYFVYRKTYRGTVYSKNFNLTLLLVAIITTIVMLIIGSNLALSLGMVGSLSIIRFRTAIKEPRDIAFLFWSIAIGLTCGSEMYSIGLLGSVVIVAVLLLANLDLYDTTSYLLVVRGADIDAAVLQKALAPHTRAAKLRMRSAATTGEEFTYELAITKADAQNALLDAVRVLPGIESVNLVSYSGEMIG